MKSNQLIGLRALGESTSESAVFLFQKKEILKSCSFQTQAVQDAVVDEPDHAPALHVATSFSLRSSENSFIYSRSDCPTRARVEETLGRLEGGKAILFSSGMSAISTLLQALDPASVFLQNVGYTGTLSFLREHKVQVTSDEALFRAQSGKKVVFCEALRNGDSSVADLKALSTLAKEVGAAFVVDATFATPVLCRPIGTGAIVVHSLSKFIGGHSDVLAGAVATSDMAVYLKLRHLRHNLGNVPGNFECFLLLRSLKTLNLRVRRQAKSARIISERLAKHADVEVLQGAISHPALWKELTASGGNADGCKKLASPCFSIILRRGDAKQFLKRLVLFEPATSLGGVSSSADWRKRWDPSQDERLVRLSVGVEDPEDLISDILQALKEEK